jgi:MtrB/PioB family decaheme-associated outer membrane protein
MRKDKQFKLLPLVAAIFLAYGSAYAEDEVHDLITPDSSVSVGVGAINNAQDAKRFSQYTGLNQNASALLDLNYNRRNDVTGFWTKFSARNLGLDTRELNFSQSVQGNWRYALDYNEIVRRDPYTIHTGMTGIGTASPTINLIAFPNMTAGGTPSAAGTVNAANPNGYKLPVAPAVANDVELKLKRTALGVTGEKWLTPELQFELSFRNEDKKGARMFGRAGLGSSDMLYSPATSGLGSYAILLTPEPIDSTTQLLEGRLNYNREALSVTAGYFGSFYVNHFNSLSPVVPGVLNRGTLGAAVGAGATLSSSVQQLASSAVDLPPDNQAHQLYASGNYAFSDSTRSNFKVSYTHATQNQAFTGVGLTPTNLALNSLNGVVDTTLAQFGLSMRPLKALSVNASLRYEDRADKTPLNVYNYGSVLTASAANNALNATTNWNSASQTRTSAKLDGTYRLPFGYSIMLGGDWERKASPLPPNRAAIVQNQVFLRTLLNEYGVHGEVRKTMSETLNGALGFEYKQRRGGDWWTPNGLIGNVLTNTTAAGLPVSYTNTVLPVMYMDRDRTKLRGNLDWEASEKLSLVAVLEHTQDNYLRQPALPVVQVIPTPPGAQTIIGESLSLDSTYMVSENWRVNAFASRSYNRWNVNKANLGDDTRNTDDTMGIGLRGQATSRLSVGVDILATRDVTTFNNVVAAGTGVNAPNALGNIVGFNGTFVPGGNYLPAIHYQTNKLNLHAQYAVDKMSAVLAMFSYQQFKTDDWQWGYNGTPFLYSDNTSVSQPMNQKLKYLSVSYQLKF